MRCLQKLCSLLAIVLIVAGCATQAKTYSWKDVGRIVEPTESSYGTHAYLQVYTRIKEENAFSDVTYRYYAYEPYTIYNSEGDPVRHVESNKTREINEPPPVVELSPGKYVIVPDGLFLKSNIVGVVIREGKKTVVRFTS